jgi:hypothetical protein
VRCHAAPTSRTSRARSGTRTESGDAPVQQGGVPQGASLVRDSPAVDPGRVVAALPHAKRLIDTLLDKSS